ncbi:hypothetical protein HMPREF9238_01436 [Gleimia europaea ACS-120-V-Col10b]|uniref:Uncharacterized protein n=1 Tax=Gleimia europaea ACS-120-V-Col10b TaxID=883069 RepID=A0A9W5RFN0_9ACTO|nr:hypothetical protein HMPREF9238_01436 [Gleimia europaea ACS-120-V-Col10b]
MAIEGWIWPVWIGLVDEGGYAPALWVGIASEGGKGQKKGPGERPVEHGRRREVGEKEEQEKTEAKLSPVRAPLVELPAFAGLLG